MNHSNPSIVEIQHLSRSFGSKEALQDVSISVAPGQVFGLVGENGAGKTTLIRHILGLLAPETGTVSVMGDSPVDCPENVLANIGYVSEDRDLPDWMSIGQLLNFSKAFYPNWDMAYQFQLIDSFTLDINAKIKSLSRGERARVCLVNALSHRPPLLLLDEPSSGLDPLVRQDVLSAVIQSVADEGRTVIFSSHLLEEVQRVADQICMIDHGKKILDEPIDELFERHSAATIHFQSPHTTLPPIDGVIDSSGGEAEWQVTAAIDYPTLEKEIARIGGQIVESHQPSLTEIFVANSRRNSVSRTQPRVVKKEMA